MARLDTDLQVLKSSNPIHERLKTAYGYWGTYPLQRELLVDSPRREATDEHVVSETYLVLLKLDEVHKAAVDVLMSRSKEQGGNPTLIWKSANYCRELLADYQKTHKSYPANRESDYWPECLGPTLFELPADIRQAIQDGNAEVRTLCVPQERLIDALPKLTGEEQPEVIGEPTPDTLATTIEAGLRNRIHIVKADSPEMMAFDQEFEELSGIAYPPKNVGEWMTVLILARFDQTWIDKAMCTFGEPGFEDCGELPRPYVSTGGVTMGDAPATLEERQAKFGSPQFTPVLMMRLRQYATENANARKSKTPVGQSKGDAEAGGGKSKTDDKNNAVSRVVGVYNWAISEISGADAMTIKELFNAIQIHPSMKSEFLEKLPNNPETFGTYLRRGGIERYNVSGDRQHRPSRRPKKH